MFETHVSARVINVELFWILSQFKYTLPTYQANSLSKVRSFKVQNPGINIFIYVVGLVMGEII